LKPLEIWSDRARTLVLDGAALAIVLGLSVLLIINVTGLVRVLLALAFVLYVPGRAVVTSFPSTRHGSRLALPVMLSISIVALVSAVALWIRAWNPIGIFCTFAALSAAAFAVSLRRSVGAARPIPREAERGIPMSVDVPTWIAQLELSGGARLQGVGTRPSLGYSQARILVRLHRQPIGFLDLPLPAEGLDWQAAVSAAELQFADSIRQHLAEDGVNSPNVPLSELTDLPVECRAGLVQPVCLPISVVVPTHNRSAALTTCLRSLRRQQHPAFEVLVVDNAPTDDETRRIFHETVGGDERFRYVVEPVQGLSRARNFGMRVARFDHVAFTDDDVAADPYWLTTLARGFAREPGVVCVTGLVAPGTLESAPERYFDRRVSWSERMEPCRYDNSSRRTPYFPFDPGLLGTGANFAVDRDATMAIGGFDEALGAGSPAHGGEDLDIFVRLLRAGGVLTYEPSALVWHFHRALDDELRQQMRAYGIGFAAYVLKQLHDAKTRRAFIRQLPRRAWDHATLLRHDANSEQRGSGYAAAEVWGYLLGPLAYRRSRRAVERRRATSA